MSTGGEAVLETFVQEVTEIVRRGGDERTLTSEVADRLVTALAGGLALDPEVTAPDPAKYVMYPLYVAPDKSFSVASAVWNVGQETPIHDHGVWGVVGIHSGVERELRYDLPAGDGPVELLEQADWGPGEVTVCCTTDQDVHKVKCGSDVPCVGIHVYGGDIGEIRRRSYDPATGEVSYFTSAWSAPARETA